MKGEEDLGYKRAHFFKHFLTEDDWNARHVYHFEKQCLHELVFHGLGIHDAKQSLLVKATQPEASLRVEITPGLAIDKQGREIIVREEERLTLDPSQYSLPTTVYFKIVYTEMAADRIRFPDGRIENKYFRETYKFVVGQAPASDSELELARVSLGEEVAALLDAKDPENPEVNEIDLRYRIEHSSHEAIPRDVSIRLMRILRERKQSFDRLGGNAKLGAVAALGQSFAIIHEILDANILSYSTVPMLMQAFRLLDEQMITATLKCIDSRYTERPEWHKHLANCKAFRQILQDPTRSMQQKLALLLVQLEKITFSYAHIERLIGNDRRVYTHGQAHALAKSYPLSSNWDFVKVWSAEFPQVLDIDDLEWLKMGELNITDPSSEKKYQFRISDARDAWTNRQRLYFPDGVLIEEKGVAHEGGFSEIVVSGVIPDTHLAIIRMMDYARGDFELKISVNGRDVGISQCEGFDRRARWRNWPFVIPAYFVNDTVLRIKQTPLTADRDVNMFYYWFYQPINW